MTANSSLRDYCRVCGGPCKLMYDLNYLNYPIPKKKEKKVAATKGRARYEIRDVPATGQGIADALLKTVADADKVFAASTVTAVSFNPGTAENDFTHATPSALTVTIKES